MRRFSVLLGTIALSASGSAARTFEIVVEGRPATAIVLPQTPRTVEEFAAKELQHHIRKSSGAAIKIVREGDSLESYAGLIYLGHGRASRAAGIDPAKLDTNGFTIRLVDGNLYLAGQDDDSDPITDSARTGTLFAVYEFLERHLGVRWLWPGALGEWIPMNRTLRVESWNQTKSPRYDWTGWRCTEAHLNKSLWPSADSADEYLRVQAVWKKRLRFAGPNYILPTHSFPHFWNSFGNSIPEIFHRLPDGRRRPLKGDDGGNYITMCVSEPKFWDLVMREWRHQGQPEILKVGENDSPGMCTCVNCRAWDAPDRRFSTSPYWSFSKIPDSSERFSERIGLVEGSPPGEGGSSSDAAPSLSDRYARFYLAVFEKARQINPRVTVAGFAYANYWRAPKTTKLNDQFLISDVPPLWFPYSERMSRDLRGEWDGWRATGANLIFRPNLTLAGHAMPIDYARPLIEDLRYLASHDAIGMDFDSLVGSWATQGPTLYALGRSLQRPDLTADEILNEYLAVFGPAADAVRHYFKHWEQVSRSLREEDINRFYDEFNGEGRRNWILIADRIFTPKVMQEGRRRLAQAIAAATGNAQARARVAFLQKGFHHAELSLDALAAHKARLMEPTARNETTLRNAIRRLHRYRANTQNDLVANIGYLRSHEPAEWVSMANSTR